MRDDKVYNTTRGVTAQHDVQGGNAAYTSLTIQKGGVLLPNLILLIDQPFLHLICSREASDGCLSQQVAIHMLLHLDRVRSYRARVPTTRTRILLIFSSNHFQRVTVAVRLRTVRNERTETPQPRLSCASGVLKDNLHKILPSPSALRRCTGAQKQARPPSFLCHYFELQLAQNRASAYRRVALMM